MKTLFVDHTRPITPESLKNHVKNNTIERLQGRVSIEFSIVIFFINHVPIGDVRFLHP